MENLVNSLVQYGALGVVAAVSLYQSWILHNKFCSLLESTIRIQERLLNQIEVCHEISKSKS